MRQRTLWFATLLVLSAEAALAQGYVGPTGPSSPVGQPGVDIYTTLNPRPPQSNVTQQSTTTVPTFDVGTPPVAPLGFPLSNVIVYPTITGGAFYDDNVFASNSNRQGDWATFVRPEYSWRSNNWTNIQAFGGAFVEKRWYNRFKSEDQINGGIGAGGEIRPSDDTQIVGRIQYLHAHEDRGTSDQINNTFTSPITYNQVEAAAAINNRRGRFWTSVGIAGALIKFGGAATVGGVAADFSYRDGAIVRVPARLGYVVAPSTSVFAEVSGNRRDFQHNLFTSEGWRAVGGMLFEPGQGQRFKGEIFGGYMYQHYVGSAFQTVSTWTWGSSLAVLIAPNLTGVLEGRRDAKEASLSGGTAGAATGGPGDGVSIVETQVGGRIDWRIAPNVVIGGGATYLVDEFKGANRTDRTLSPLASAKWFVNRHLTLGFDYRYLTFDSSGLGVLGYYRNVYLLTANLRW